MAFNMITSVNPDSSTTSTVGPTLPASDVNGPLSDLNQPDFTYNLYAYPSVQNPAYPGMSHNIIFYINIPQQSYWNNSTVTNSNAPKPVANRLGAASNFSLANLGRPGDEIGTRNIAAALENLVLESKTTRTTTAIGLYIPPTMVFSHTLQYENVSLASSLGILGDIASTASLLDHGQIGKAALSLTNYIPDLIHSLVGSDQRFIPEGQAIRDILLKANGIADNPQNFLLFKQIDFRKFQFDFILTPENATETSIINQIIKLFRFHSVPEVYAGSTGRFFVPPSEFDIEILHNGNTNINIPRINTCVCTSVSVNYANAGQWVTYTDGQPVQIKLSLQFTETQILTKTLVNAGL